MKKKGCFYHLCSNIWKYIQNLGLQVEYNADHDFPLHLRMLCTLAFRSRGDFTNGFDVLCQEIRNNFNVDADDLLDYFEDTYIGRFQHNAPHRNLIFAIEILNMYNRTNQKLLKTSSIIELWHGSFQGYLSSLHHPDLWEFINILKKEEAYVRASILQHQGGIHYLHREDVMLIATQGS